MSKPNQHRGALSETDLQPVAGGGLLDRRLFLKGSGALARAVSAAGAGLFAAGTAHSETLKVPEWTTMPGGEFTEYGMPSRYEAGVKRASGAKRNPLFVAGAQAGRSPLHALEGMITPSGLHFEVTHNGIPDIDPDRHRLIIHGLVKRPLSFTVEALSRYPMTSRIHFVECAGNSGALAAPNAVPGTAQILHGLVSCSEWTGISLAVLLQEAGIDPKAKWILADGADPASVSRSIPLEKAMDDVMVALYQNGERIRPSNGYPMRLLVPGFQGNMNIKWLRQVKLTEGPSQTRYETSRYSMLLKDGRVAEYKFFMDAKSVITRPSPGFAMHGPGLYEISGIAWSGHGKVRKVEVSADGGKSWAATELSEPVLSKAITRFRMPWRWDGSPAVLQSRATDETGDMQPTRDVLVAARGTKGFYHWNSVNSWAVAGEGSVTHVYA
jgi:sulfane dehydrogenase subunit SoxC